MTASAAAERANPRAAAFRPGVTMLRELPAIVLIPGAVRVLVLVDALLVAVLAARKPDSMAAAALVH